MAEPTQGVPFFDWLSHYISIIIPAMLAVFGGLLAMSNRYKASVQQKLTDQRTGLDHELAKVWSEMRNHIAVQVCQGSNIAVLQSEQRNTALHLEDIKQTTIDTNKKIDGLADKLVTVLAEIKRAR